MRKKTLAIALAVIAIVSVVTTGTLAWLSAQTDPITNTFSPSTIGLELEETTGAAYKMVPGATIAKNPKVTVTAGSEACYVFVKIEKVNNFANYMSYQIGTDWTELTAGSGIYYIELTAVEAAAGQEYPVLLNNQVTVLNTVTKAMMDGLTNAANYPKLVITAYAIQSANLPGTGANGAATPAEAWALASAQGN